MMGTYIFLKEGAIRMILNWELICTGGIRFWGSKDSKDSGVIRINLRKGRAAMDLFRIGQSTQKMVQS